MKRGYQVFNLIEEITLLDGNKYFEIANIFLNGIAEYAFNKNLIKGVRIVKLNIFHSNEVELYEKYINQNEEIPDYNLSEWIVWKKDNDEQRKIYENILRSNNIN